MISNEEGYPAWDPEQHRREFADPVESQPWMHRGWTPKAVDWDVWGTIITAGGIETVFHLLETLGYDHQKSPALADSFLRHCLTSGLDHPVPFIHQAADHLRNAGAAPALGPEEVDGFLEIVDLEKRACAVFGDVLPTLHAIRAAGIPQGIISNIWSFPVRHIFDSPNGSPEDQLLPPLGLGEFFEHKTLSCEVGHRKPEPEIFLEAARKHGLEPGDILFVGDSLSNDALAALNAGMKVALIDRHGKYRKEVQGDPRILYLDSLVKLLPFIGLRPMRASN